MESSDPDQLLVERVRRGDTDAWRDLIDRYEGRLTSYVECRLGRRPICEDIVQETFIGFLNSLPNYDGSRPLENYLFTICAYKLTDHLRREGRRPTIPLSRRDESSTQWELPGPAERASSRARSGERRRWEEAALVQTLRTQIGNWKSKGNWPKLKCLELLFVRGWANRDAAAALHLTEQQVANYKSDFITRTRSLLRRQQLPDDLFPELVDE